MMRSLCNFFLGNHDKCIAQQSKSEENANTIQALRSQVVSLLGQIQELKAVNDYQAFQLEQKLNLLEKENSSLKDELEALKKKQTKKSDNVTTCQATDGSIVKIVHPKKTEDSNGK